MFERLLEFDRQLLLKLNFDGGPILDYIFYVVSGNATWIPLYIFILYLIYRRYGWRFMWAAGAFIALTVITADQVANIFKFATPKLRPVHEPLLDGLVHSVNNYKGGMSGTISAHTATVFCVVFFTTRLIKCVWYVIPMYFWAILVAYSRIYLGVHYPMDLVLGFIDAAIMSWLFLRLFRWFLRRYGPKYGIEPTEF